MTLPTRILPCLPLVRRRLVAWLSKPVSIVGRTDGPVVLVKLDRLGDFVLALGALRLLVDHYGAARCRLIVSPQATPLASREFPAVSRLVLPASLGHGRTLWTAVRHRRALAQLGASLSVCLRHQRWDYDELVLSWLRAPRSIRVNDPYTRSIGSTQKFYEYSAPGSLPSDLADDNSGSTDETNSSQLSRELRLHRIVVEHILKRPIQGTELLPSLTAPAAGVPGVVISPFGSEPIRDFPAECLMAAARAARAVSDVPLRLIGIPMQAARLQRLAAQWRGQSLSPVEVVSDLSFEAYLHNIASAPLVLTAETATAHLATALDRPAIIALGGGHYGQFGPWRRSNRQVWLTHPVSCFGCNWQCPYSEPWCLTRIPAETAATFVRGFLGGSSFR